MLLLSPSRLGPCFCQIQELVRSLDVDIDGERHLRNRFVLLRCVNLYQGENERLLFTILES